MAYFGAPFPFNTYNTDAGMAAYVGMPRDFPDADYSKQFIVNNSAWIIKAILVQNVGAAISPGQCLMWVATKSGLQVQKCTNGNLIAGFVPGAIVTAATIPDGAYFWMVIHGPSNVLTDTSAILEGSQLEASAATVGSVRLESTVPAANKLCRGATAWAANGSAAVLIRAMVDTRLGV